MPDPSGPTSSPAAFIAGVTIGGLAALTISFSMGWFWRRQRRQSTQQTSVGKASSYEQGSTPVRKAATSVREATTSVQEANAVRDPVEVDIPARHELESGWKGHEVDSPISPVGLAY